MLKMGEISRQARNDKLFSGTIIIMNEAKRYNTILSESERGVFRSARASSLLKEEKETMRLTIVSKIRRKEASVFGSFSMIGMLFSRRAFVSGMLVSVLVLSSGLSVASAAERSLPGELLYPVKVRVNEPMTGLLKRTKQERAEWAQARVDRRIEEAEILLASSKLDESESEKIGDLLEEHRETLRKYSNDEDFETRVRERSDRIEVKVETREGKKKYRVVKREEKNEQKESESDDRDEEESDEKENSRSGKERVFVPEKMEKELTEKKTNIEKKFETTSVKKKKDESENRKAEGEKESEEKKSGKDDDTEDDEEEDEDDDNDQDGDDNSSGSGSGGGDEDDREED